MSAKWRIPYVDGSTAEWPDDAQVIVRDGGPSLADRRQAHTLEIVVRIHGGVPLSYCRTFPHNRRAFRHHGRLRANRAPVNPPCFQQLWLGIPFAPAAAGRQSRKGGDRHQSYVGS